MDIDAILAAFAAACPGQAFEAQQLPVEETVVAVPATCLLDLVGLLRDTFDIHHLSAITGQDRGEALELLYHFWAGRGLTLRVTLPYDAPRISTLAETLPGAIFYEREILEMLGVTFEGLPDPRPLLLPEDWDGSAPLRVTEET